MAEPTLPKRARLLAAAMSVNLVATGLAAAPTTAAEETPQAREQARLCERLDEEAGIEACRAALALGLRPERREAVREVLANHLVDLERWTDLA